MKKTGMQYIKCPRCELNYILKKDKYCDVCKSEMKAGILKESDMDDFELEEGMEICPICKVNYINPGERMCTTCQEEQLSVNKDDEPDWRGFVDKDDSDEDLDLLPVEEDDEIDEELEGAFAKDLDEGDFDEEDLDDELNEDFDDDFDDDDDIDDDYDDEDDMDDDDDDDDDFDDDDDIDDLPRKRKK